MRNSSAGAVLHLALMKNITITLGLAAAALFAMPSTIDAQTPPAPTTHPHHKGGRLEFLTEKLGLDATQQAQIKAIFEKYRPQIKAIASKGKANLTDADKAALRDLRKQENAEVKTVLTPAQLATLKELRKEHHKGGKGGTPPPANPGTTTPAGQ